MTGSDDDLGSASVTLDVPAGTEITQLWNAEASTRTGRMRITLPPWARVQPGSPYTATGFCLKGPGAVSVVR
jgi:hypothetical protein